jgi:hypothetical protein
MSLFLIEQRGPLRIKRSLTEGYDVPEDQMDAEEVVGMILGDMDRVQSKSKRKKMLALAMKYMKQFGLDKERDWMSQYNMRARG